MLLVPSGGQLLSQLTHLFLHLCLGEHSLDKLLIKWSSFKDDLGMYL